MTAALAIVGVIVLAVVGAIVVEDVRAAGAARADALERLGAERVAHAAAEHDRDLARVQVADLTAELARTKALLADQARALSLMNRAGEKSADPDVALERLKAATS